MDQKVYDTILELMDAMKNNFEFNNPSITFGNPYSGESKDECEQRVDKTKKDKELNSINTQISGVKDSCNMIIDLLIQQKNKINQ